MPRTCTVCSHPRRHEIDECLVSGQSNRGIAKQFGLDDAAVFRHRNAHLPAALTKATEAQEAARADDLLDRLEALARETLEILRDARADGRKGRSVALFAIARAEKQIELLARLRGELRDGPTVNVLVASAEWTDLQARLRAALEPFPDAWAAVRTAITAEQAVSNGENASPALSRAVSGPGTVSAGRTAAGRKGEP